MFVTHLVWCVSGHWWGGFTTWHLHRMSRKNQEDEEVTAVVGAVVTQLMWRAGEATGTRTHTATLKCTRATLHHWQFTRGRRSHSNTLPPPPPAVGWRGEGSLRNTGLSTSDKGHVLIMQHGGRRWGTTSHWSSRSVRLVYWVKLCEKNTNQVLLLFSVRELKWGCLIRLTLDV